MNPADRPQPAEGRPAGADRLRAARLDRPAAIPMTFHINDACWNLYPQDALAELMASYPALFDGAEPPAPPHRPDYLPNARADRPFTDPWGCVWRTTCDGIVGTVTHHPLADWADFDSYAPPDPARGDGMGTTWPRRLKPTPDLTGCAWPRSVTATRSSNWWTCAATRR